MGYFCDRIYFKHDGIIVKRYERNDMREKIKLEDHIWPIFDKLFEIWTQFIIWRGWWQIQKFGELEANGLKQQTSFKPLSRKTFKF